MTLMEKFLYEREALRQCLEAAGVQDILLNRNAVPSRYPAAVLILAGERGKHGTSRRYVSSDLTFEVYLVVSAHETTDPDMDLYKLKEEFRRVWLEKMNRDIPEVEYYESRASARPVKIARLILTKPDEKAAR